MSETTVTVDGFDDKGFHYLAILNTVTYKDGGSTYHTDSVNHNEKTTRPATDPSRERYTFQGWYTADGTEWNFNTPVTGDLTLYAKYELTRVIPTPPEVTDIPDPDLSIDDDPETGDDRRPWWHYALPLLILLLLLLLFLLLRKPTVNYNANGGAP